MALYAPAALHFSHSLQGSYSLVVTFLACAFTLTCPCRPPYHNRGPVNMKMRSFLTRFLISLSTPLRMGVWAALLRNHTLQHLYTSKNLTLQHTVIIVFAPFMEKLTSWIQKTLRVIICAVTYTLLFLVFLVALCVSPPQLLVLGSLLMLLAISMRVLIGFLNTLSTALVSCAQSAPFLTLAQFIWPRMGVLNHTLNRNTPTHVSITENVLQNITTCCFSLAQVIHSPLINCLWQEAVGALAHTQLQKKVTKTMGILSNNVSFSSTWYRKYSAQEQCNSSISHSLVVSVNTLCIKTKIKIKNTMMVGCSLDSLHQGVTMTQYHFTSDHSAVFKQMHRYCPASAFLNILANTLAYISVLCKGTSGCTAQSQCRVSISHSLMMSVNTLFIVILDQCKLGQLGHVMCFMRHWMASACCGSCTTITTHTQRACSILHSPVVIANTLCIKIMEAYSLTFNQSILAATHMQLGKAIPHLTPGQIIIRTTNTIFSTHINQLWRGLMGIRPGLGRGSGFRKVEPHQGYRPFGANFTLLIHHFKHQTFGLTRFPLVLWTLTLSQQVTFCQAISHNIGRIATFPVIPGSHTIWFLLCVITHVYYQSHMCLTSSFLCVIAHLLALSTNTILSHSAIPCNLPQLVMYLSLAQQESHAHTCFLVLMITATLTTAFYFDITLQWQPMVVTTGCLASTFMRNAFNQDWTWMYTLLHPAFQLNHQRHNLHTILFYLFTNLHFFSFMIMKNNTHLSEFLSFLLITSAAVRNRLIAAILLSNHCRFIFMRGGTWHRQCVEVTAQFSYLCERNAWIFLIPVWGTLILVETAIASSMLPGIHTQYWGFCLLTPVFALSTQGIYLTWKFVDFSAYACQILNHLSIIFWTHLSHVLLHVMLAPLGVGPFTHSFGTMFPLYCIQLTDWGVTVPRKNRHTVMLHLLLTVFVTITNTIPWQLCTGSILVTQLTLTQVRPYSLFFISHLNRLILHRCTYLAKQMLTRRRRLLLCLHIMVVLLSSQIRTASAQTHFSPLSVTHPQLFQHFVSHSPQSSSPSALPCSQNFSTHSTNPSLLPTYSSVDWDWPTPYTTLCQTSGNGFGELPRLIHCPIQQNEAHTLWPTKLYCVAGSCVPVGISGNHSTETPRLSVSHKAPSSHVCKNISLSITWDSPPENGHTAQGGHSFAACWSTHTNLGISFTLIQTSPHTLLHTSTTPRPGTQPATQTPLLMSAKHPYWKHRGLVLACILPHVWLLRSKTVTHKFLTRTWQTDHSRFRAISMGNILWQKLDLIVSSCAIASCWVHCSWAQFIAAFLVYGSFAVMHVAKGGASARTPPAHHTGFKDGCWYCCSLPSVLGSTLGNSSDQLAALWSSLVSFTKTPRYMMSNLQKKLSCLWTCTREWITNGYNTLWPVCGGTRLREKLSIKINAQQVILWLAASLLTLSGILATVLVLWYRYQHLPYKKHDPHVVVPLDEQLFHAAEVVHTLSLKELWKIWSHMSFTLCSVIHSQLLTLGSIVLGLALHTSASTSRSWKMLISGITFTQFVLSTESARQDPLSPVFICLLTIGLMLWRADCSTYSICALAMQITVCMLEFISNVANLDDCVWHLTHLAAAGLTTFRLIQCYGTFQKLLSILPYFSKHFQVRLEIQSGQKHYSRTSKVFALLLVVAYKTKLALSSFERLHGHHPILHGEHIQKTLTNNAVHMWYVVPETCATCFLLTGGGIIVSNAIQNGCLPLIRHLQRIKPKLYCNKYTFGTWCSVLCVLIHAQLRTGHSHMPVSLVVIFTQQFWVNMIKSSMRSGRHNQHKLERHSMVLRKLGMHYRNGQIHIGYDRCRHSTPAKTVDEIGHNMLLLQIMTSLAPIMLHFITPSVHPISTWLYGAIVKIIQQFITRSALQVIAAHVSFHVAFLALFTVITTACIFPVTFWLLVRGDPTTAVLCLIGMFALSMFGIFLLSEKIIPSTRKSEKFFDPWIRHARELSFASKFTQYQACKASWRRTCVGALLLYRGHSQRQVVQHDWRSLPAPCTHKISRKNFNRKQHLTISNRTTTLQTAHSPYNARSPVPRSCQRWSSCGLNCRLTPRHYQVQVRTLPAFYRTRQHITHYVTRNVQKYSIGVFGLKSAIILGIMLTYTSASITSDLFFTRTKTQNLLPLFVPDKQSLPFNTLHDFLYQTVQVTSDRSLDRESRDILLQPLPFAKTTHTFLHAPEISDFRRKGIPNGSNSAELSGILHKVLANVNRRVLHTAKFAPFRTHTTAYQKKHIPIVLVNTTGASTTTHSTSLPLGADYIGVLTHLRSLIPAELANRGYLLLNGKSFPPKIQRQHLHACLTLRLRVPGGVRITEETNKWTDPIRPAGTLVPSNYLVPHLPPLDIFDHTTSKETRLQFEDQVAKFHIDLSKNSSERALIGSKIPFPTRRIPF